MPPARLDLLRILAFCALGNIYLAATYYGLSLLTRPAQRRHHTQGLQGGEHGGTLHRAAVVGMQNHLIRAYRLSSAKILEDLTGLGAALFGIDLPVNDLAADMTSRVKRDPLRRC